MEFRPIDTGCVAAKGNTATAPPSYSQINALPHAGFLLFLSLLSTTASIFIFPFTISFGCFHS
jgi:hypothetical protein